MTDKEKIVVVINKLDIGGTEKHLYQVLAPLQALGHMIEVVTLRGGGALENDFRSLGISIVTLKTNRLPSLLYPLITIFRLRQYYKKNRIKCIHFFLPESYLLGMIALKLANVSVTTIMSRRSLNQYQKKHRFAGWVEKKLHKHVDVVLGNSQATVDQLMMDESVPNSKLRLIYSGIDLRPFEQEYSKAQWRIKHSIPLDSFVMVKVANLIPYKGHIDLIEALGLIKDLLPQDWRLVCVGKDTGIGSQLKLKARQLEIDQHILWLGLQTNIPEIYASVDCGILASHEEGFSNAILEGMAAGKPMVVTDAGGNKESVVNNQTGYVVPQKSPKLLAEAILKLVNTKELAQSFGKSAKNRVFSKFSLKNCINQYDKFYKSL